jgi:hypothetical protein
MTIRQRLLAGLALATAVSAAAGIEAAQRGWVMTLKTPARSAAAVRSEVLVARPEASISGGANGIYCAHQAENGVGVHDLGAIPAGIHVVVTVESYSEAFDPVAAVATPVLGAAAANSVNVATFYDNDSGEDKDAKIDFVTPRSGNYVLFVGDFTDTIAGCYRYKVVIE